ncbi:MAG: pitrilysin family protein [Chloroflexi bacterium]|nr:pitrilysin family protein [Chloroflexota bacterium]
MQEYPASTSIRRVALANGAVLLAYENPASPSVVVAGSLAAGSQFEGDEPAGLAHITAQGLMSAAADHDFDALHGRLEGIGADLQFSAGSHTVSFFGKALAEDLPILADALAAVLREPRFPEQEIANLRDEVLTSLHFYAQDTSWRAEEAFNRLLYPAQHPYHREVIGTLASVAQINPAHLRRFHERVYGPAGLVITVVGAVETERAIHTLRSHLDDWQPILPERNPALPVPVPPLASLRKERIAIPGKTQTDLVLGVAGPSRFADDYLPASLANSVLGQFGMMGRIGESVRERHGFSYYAYSRMDGGYDRGAWCVLVGVEPQWEEASLDLIRHEIDSLRSRGITAEDLADNQAYFKGRLPLQLETNDGIAATLLTMECFGLGLDYLLEYGGHIDRIRRDDVVAAMEKYWPEDEYALALAGPEPPYHENQ